MSSLRIAVSRVIGAVLMGIMVFAVAASPASAADKPFWEKAEAKKSESAAGKTYSTYSKRYASGYSKKKRYASRKKLGGWAAATEPRRKKKGYKVAALGGAYYGDYQPKKSLTGGSVRWAANASCLAGGLKSVIYQVAANFGPVTVSSTCRSSSRNRAVGGAKRSKHLSGNAADFRVHGNIRGVYAFLRSSGSVGGLKHYGGGLFRIDNGDRRSW